VNSNNKGVETILADYSYVGYHHCEKEIPLVDPVNYTCFDVTSHGAIPNDGQSDRKAV